MIKAKLLAAGLGLAIASSAAIAVPDAEVSGNTGLCNAASLSLAIELAKAKRKDNLNLGTCYTIAIDQMQDQQDFGCIGSTTPVHDAVLDTAGNYTPLKQMGACTAASECANNLEGQYIPIVVPTLYGNVNVQFALSDLFSNPLPEGEEEYPEGESGGAYEYWGCDND